MQSFLFMTNQWQPLPHSFSKRQFKHKHSSDQCQVLSLAGLKMKEIDQYTSREIYSYPFCPKIYKTAIGRPKCKNDEVLFDLQVVVESVPLRLGHSECKIQEGKILDLIKGFLYLTQRYGLFLPTQEMIGWTKEGVVKVWFNQDFSSNQIKQRISSQKELTVLLLAILKKHGLIDKNKLIFSENLNQMLASFKKKSNKNSKQVNFEEMQRIREEEITKDRHVLTEPSSPINPLIDFKERKIKKCQTFWKKQNLNPTPSHFCFNNERNQQKIKTIFFTNKNSEGFEKNGLSFARNTSIKLEKTLRPKSEVGKFSKKPEEIVPKRLQDGQEADNLGQKSKNHIFSQRNSKKSFTNFETSTRKAQKHTLSSFCSDQQLSSNSLGKREPKQSSIAFSSPSFNPRPKSQYRELKTQTQMTAIRAKVQQRNSLNSLQAKPKSLQQALKQDVDALFRSNIIQPQEVDKEKLKNQLDALLQML